MKRSGLEGFSQVKFETNVPRRPCFGLRGAASAALGLRTGLIFLDGFDLFWVAC